MDDPNLFDQVYELGEVISSGPHSELRRCRKLGKFLTRWGSFNSPGARPKAL